MLPPDVGWGGDTNMASDGGGDERPLDPLKPLGGMWFTTVAMGREEAVQAEELIRCGAFFCVIIVILGWGDCAGGVGVANGWGVDGSVLMNSLLRSCEAFPASMPFDC